MLKYIYKYSQGWVWVHECDTISYNVEGLLTSLVLYLPQARTAWVRVQDSCLICNRIPHLPWDPAGEGGDEVDPLSFGAGRHSRLYQDIDGGDKGSGAEGRERFNKGLFLVQQLVILEEISRGSRLHWCWFYWYGENQHQMIFQGYDWGVNDGLDWQILHSVEDQSYGDRGRPIIAIVYKYNSRKVLLFVATVGVGSTR